MSFGILDFGTLVPVGFCTRKGEDHIEQLEGRGKLKMRYKKRYLLQKLRQRLYYEYRIKKIELIEWLARVQDEKLIQRIEALRKGSISEIYESRTPKSLEDLQEKLNRSEEDIKAGRVHTHEEVKSYFKNKFEK